MEAVRGWVWIFSGIAHYNQNIFNNLPQASLFQALGSWGRGKRESERKKMRED